MEDMQNITTNIIFEKSLTDYAYLGRYYYEICKNTFFLFVLFTMEKHFFKMMQIILQGLSGNQLMRDILNRTAIKSQ